MILFELTGTEQHPVYQDLEIANGSRQYDFLRSVITASMAIDRPFLSSTVLKALNYHAIACLHISAGEYRPCGVTVGTYQPPEHYQVQALMEDFINSINRMWENVDPVALAALVLWRLNHIHPFINGNGRTARAACYFVLCLRLQQWLPGTKTLPELLKRDRNDYVQALQQVDQSLAAGALDLAPLHALLSKLLAEQINGNATAVPNP